jgi:hypothetical protein
VAFDSTFRYIDDALSINNNQFQSYVDLIFPNELEIKYTTECSTSASYLDILLKLGTNGKITTQLYDKRDYFNFSIVNIPYLCSNIPVSPSYGIYIVQLIRFARAFLTYNHFSVRFSLLTNKLMSQGFPQYRLEGDFDFLFGCHNDLFCPYSVSLGHMLSDVFHTKAF